MNKTYAQCFHESISYFDGKGGIETRSKLPIYLGSFRQMSELPPVPMRNNLLLACHPVRVFCICSVDPIHSSPEDLEDFEVYVAGQTRKFELDLASGSRTHGQFTFSDKLVSPDYFVEKPEDKWKRIIYGSLLQTDCKQLRYTPIKYIVTQDDRRDEKGFSEDDPTNKYHWYTGDSHAKASKKLMDFLGLSVIDENGYVSEPATTTPIQFRVAEYKKWIGKGTISYNSDLDGSGYDMAIPQSSLKGIKLPLGNYQATLLFGSMFEAEVRESKPGWMLFQWFKYETLEKDGIISSMRERCNHLRNSANSIVDLADYLRVEIGDKQINLTNFETQEEYEDKLVRLIKSDARGLLLFHPYVVDRIRRLLASSWLDLAKSAGVKYHSVMCQPDEILAHYHTIDSNGRVIGEKVFCCGSLPQGEYIVFCNPMRHWGDVQLWQNIHEGAYIDSPGVLAAPIKLLLTLGRDTDGDFVQLIQSSKYPNMREEIANFIESPATVKFPKVAITGDLKVIAMRSMSAQTGIVAALIAKARSQQLEHVVLNIPPGGEQDDWQEMTIMEFLGQQLQIAVDSLKSAYPNNQNGLNTVGEYLKGIKTPWLSDFKNPECYRDRKCNVLSEAEDTISRLVKEVNSFWVKENLGSNTRPYYYVDTLFKDVQVSDKQIEIAYEDREIYRIEMTEAIKWKEANDGNYKKLLEATTRWQEIAIDTIETLIDGQRLSIKSWAAAYWRVANDASSGSAGIVFTMFFDEILEELREAQEKPTPKFVEVYGVQHYSWSAPQDKPWRGQLVNVKFVVAPRGKNGAGVLSADMMYPNARTQTGWHPAGIVAEAHRPRIIINETRQYLIYSVRFRRAKTTAFILLDPDISEEDKRIIFDTYF